MLESAITVRTRCTAGAMLAVILAVTVALLWDKELRCEASAR